MVPLCPIYFLLVLDCFFLKTAALGLRLIKDFLKIFGYCLPACFKKYCHFLLKNIFENVSSNFRTNSLSTDVVCLVIHLELCSNILAEWPFEWVCWSKEFSWKYFIPRKIQTLPPSFFVSPSNLFVKMAVRISFCYCLVNEGSLKMGCCYISPRGSRYTYFNSFLTLAYSRKCSLNSNLKRLMSIFSSKQLSFLIAYFAFSLLSMAVESTRTRQLCARAAILCPANSIVCCTHLTFSSMDIFCWFYSDIIACFTVNQNVDP